MLPYEKMLDFTRQNQDAKRIFKTMQKQYLDPSYHKNSGVFSPSGSLYAIAPIFAIEAQRGDLGRVTVDEMSDYQLDLLSYFWGLHVFGTWRNTLGIYQLDSDVLEDVIQSPIPDETPSNIFKRLPEWCVYFELPNERIKLTSPNDVVYCTGFWALLDYAISPIDGSSQLVLNIVLNVTGTTKSTYNAYQPLRIVISDGLTVAQAYDALFENEVEAYGDDAQYILKHKDESKKLLLTLLSVLLWVCAEEPDITNIKGEPVKKTVINKSNIQLNKKTGSFIAPSQPNIRVLGKRLGGEIRLFKELVEADGKSSNVNRKSVRPHIRRGHYHGYWAGKGQNKHFKLRWQPTLFVNG